MYVAAATTEAVVTDPAVNEPAVTEPATTDALDSTEPAPSEPPVAGAEVDDDPVCQALRRVHAAAVFYALGLAPDLVVIRTGGFTEEELVALAASGDDAIDGALAGTGLDALEDVGTVPGAETKLAAAAEAFLAEVGPSPNTWTPWTPTWTRRPKQRSSRS